MRGLAILAVLCVHLFPSGNITSNVALQILLLVRNQMWIGVVLFFALSGFLITGILFDTLGAERYFRTFFGRRCLRIFPLYYGVLGLLLLLTHPLHLDWGGQALMLLTYLPNVPFLLNWGHNPSPYINLIHFWSLAVEEQFYLLWPLLIFFLRSWRGVFLATILGCLAALAFRTGVAMAGYWPANHTLPGCMDSLLMGGGLAMLVRSRHRELVLRWGWVVFAAAMAITFAMAVYDGNNFLWEKSLYLTTIGMTVLSLGMTGLIAAALQSGSGIQRFCGHHVLRFFGRYSYGLYVYHYSLYETAHILLKPALAAHGVSKTSTVLVIGVCAAVASVVAAVLSYELYEKHFLRWKRYFPYRRKGLAV